MGAATPTPCGSVSASWSESFVYNVLVLGQPHWLFHSVYWSGPNNPQFVFSLDQVKSQLRAPLSIFLSKRKHLLISSSGGQIAADVSLKGSDPGQAAERHEVPALTVRSGGIRGEGKAGVASF